jgi:PAS domain-containing protein
MTTMRRHLSGRHLSIVLNPEDRCDRASILLARTGSHGALELLSAAWERLLGYGRGGLHGQSLGQLMAAERTADRRIADVEAAIFDEHSMASVELTLRCRSGARKRVRLHRRLHASAHTIYIVGEDRP